MAHRHHLHSIVDKEAGNIIIVVRFKWFACCSIEHLFSFTLQVCVIQLSYCEAENIIN